MWMRFSQTALAFFKPASQQGSRSASKRCDSSSFSAPSARGSKPQLSKRGAWVPCRDKYGGAAAHNRCRAQASAVERAAARDRGADEGFHQRCRGLAPSGPVPVQEQRRFAAVNSADPNRAVWERQRLEYYVKKIRGKMLEEQRRPKQRRPAEGSPLDTNVTGGLRRGHKRGQRPEHGDFRH